MKAGWKHVFSDSTPVGSGRELNQAHDWPDPNGVRQSGFGSGLVVGRRSKRKNKSGG